MFAMQGPDRAEQTMISLRYTADEATADGADVMQARQEPSPKVRHWPAS